MAGHINGRADPLDMIVSDVVLAANESLEVATHHHSRERWLATLSGTANRVATDNGTSGFLVTSGNDTYGTAVQILDTNGTPVIAGHTQFDIHRLYITDVQNAALYRIRILYGSSAAVALSSGDYTDAIYRVDNVGSDRKPLEIQIPKIPSGTKVWASVWCAAQNAQTFTFLFGIHEYTA